MSEQTGAVHIAPYITYLQERPRELFSPLADINKQAAEHTDLIISQIWQAQSQGHLERKWRVYLQPVVLVIDKIGYFQLN